MSGSGNTGRLEKVTRRAGFVASESTAGSRISSSLLETTDGGASWKRLAGPCGSLPDQQVSALNANHLWLTCGSQPAGTLQAKAVYFSTDAARNWQPTASVGLARATSVGALGSTGYLVGLAAASEQDVWLALAGGPVEVTTDRGSTWRSAFPLPSGTRGAVQVTFVGAAHGWALTPGGLWHTSDGARWESLGG